MAIIDEAMATTSTIRIEVFMIVWGPLSLSWRVSNWCPCPVEWAIISSNVSISSYRNCKQTLCIKSRDWIRSMHLLNEDGVSHMDEPEISMRLNMDFCVMRTTCKQPNASPRLARHVINWHDGPTGSYIMARLLMSNSLSLRLSLLVLSQSKLSCTLSMGSGPIWGHSNQLQPFIKWGKCLPSLERKLRWFQDQCCAKLTLQFCDLSSPATAVGLLWYHHSNISSV